MSSRAHVTPEGQRLVMCCDVMGTKEASAARDRGEMHGECARHSSISALRAAEFTDEPFA